MSAQSNSQVESREEARARLRTRLRRQKGHRTGNRRGEDNGDSLAQLVSLESQLTSLAADDPKSMSMIQSMLKAPKTATKALEAAMADKAHDGERKPSCEEEEDLPESLK